MDEDKLAKMQALQARLQQKNVNNFKFFEMISKIICNLLQFFGMFPQPQGGGITIQSYNETNIENAGHVVIGQQVVFQGPPPQNEPEYPETDG